VLLASCAICEGTARSVEAGSSSGGNAADTGDRVLSAEMDGAIKSLIQKMEDAAAGAGRWAARIENITPHYTTDWGQLPVAS